ncbi:hypothetical protein [Streptomyces lydicus]|uniref:hypothetical protein n=1 Tax=Streptomyces lydicus TaxID=47763 RepID=UPI0037ACF413
MRDLWLAPGGQVYLVLPIGRDQPLQPGRLPPTAVEALCEGWQAERQDIGGAAWIMLRPSNP